MPEPFSKLELTLAEDLDRALIELEDTDADRRDAQHQFTVYREMVSVLMERLAKAEKTIAQQHQTIRRFMGIVDDLDRLEATDTTC